MGRAIEFGEWEGVRVVKLIPAGRYFVERLPQVGEQGTIVHIDPTAKPEALHTVECTDDDGNTLWLADLTAQEMERS